MLPLEWLRASAVQNLTPAPLTCMHTRTRAHTHCSGRMKKHGRGMTHDSVNTTYDDIILSNDALQEVFPVTDHSLLLRLSCSLSRQKNQTKKKTGLKTWNTRRRQSRQLSISGAIAESCKTRGFQANEIC